MTKMIMQMYNFRTGTHEEMSGNLADYLPQDNAALRSFELSQEVLGLSPEQALLRTLKLCVGEKPAQEQQP